MLMWLSGRLVGAEYCSKLVYFLKLPYQRDCFIGHILSFILS